MESAPVSRRQFLQAGTAGAAALLLQQRMFPHLTTAEIAAVTGKSRGNVRVILHRALAALKEMVEESMNGKK